MTIPLPNHRPPHARRRRASDDARLAILRGRGIAVVERAAFGPEHPAVIATVEHLRGQPNARTARNKADHILAFLDWCHREGLDPFDLRRAHAKIYYSQLPDRLARATRHVRMSAIRAWYLDAIDARLCSNNPFYRVGPKNIDPRTPTPYIGLEDVDRVLAYRLAKLEDGSATPVFWRDTILFYVMTRVGPRRFEAAAATWSTLEPVGGVVRWALHGKGDEDARTTLPPDVVTWLEGWRRKLAGFVARELTPADAIFPVLGQGVLSIPAYAATGPLEPLMPATLSAIYKAAMADVGLTGKRFAAHVARATAATLAYRAGANEREIQRMLRHRLLTTTHRYIKLLEDVESPAVAWQPMAAIDFTLAGIVARGAPAGMAPR